MCTYKTTAHAFISCPNSLNSFGHELNGFVPYYSNSVNPYDDLIATHIIWNVIT
jgi:hypothetical protein